MIWQETDCYELTITSTRIFLFSRLTVNREMSTVVCVDYSAVPFNEQIYVLDQRQSYGNNQHSSSYGSSQSFNEDEFCQICGDLSSGWHCGSVQLRFLFIFHWFSFTFRAITCEACKVSFHNQIISKWKVNFLWEIFPSFNFDWWWKEKV